MTVHPMNESALFCTTFCVMKLLVCPFLFVSVYTKNSTVPVSTTQGRWQPDGHAKGVGGRQRFTVTWATEQSVCVCARALAVGWTDTLHVSPPPPPAWRKQIGRQPCSEAVRPQGVTVTELYENIDSMHSASNKAKLILHDASLRLHNICCYFF